MLNPSKPALCPGCKQPSHFQFTPFCSQGCKDRDLLQWLGEGYRIAGPSAGEEDRDSGLDSGD